MGRILGIGLAAAVVAATACNGGDEAGERSTSTTVVTGPVAEPSDGGEVRLVDSGFSVYPGPAEPGGTAEFTSEAVAAGASFDVASWGVVVENTSEWVATDVEVRVELVDADGAAVATHRYQWPGAETIVLLRPGQRFAMGHTDTLDWPAERTTGPPARLEVEIGPTRWFPPDARGVEVPVIVANGDSTAAELPVVTADEVTTGVEPSEIAGQDFVVSFRTESDADRTWPMSATAVFRDAGGRIVGGTSRTNDYRTAGLPPGRLVSQGDGSGDIRLGLDVPGVDDARSEVSLDFETRSRP